MKWGKQFIKNKPTCFDNHDQGLCTHAKKQALIKSRKYWKCESLKNNASLFTLLRTFTLFVHKIPPRRKKKRKRTYIIKIIHTRSMSVQE